MSETVVIVNPNSANGKTGRIWPALSQELRSAGLDFKVHITSRPLEATEVVQAALQHGYTTVIAVGGDGTLNEVLNGFFQDDRPINPGARLGVISCGTGSDFVRSAGIPRSPLKACRRLLQGHTRLIDTGKVVFTGHSGHQEVRYFINVAGMGVDGEIVYRVNHTSKALGGFLSFLWGTVNGLIQYRNRRIRLEVDGTIRYQGDATMIAVANGQYFGGGMRVAPNAVLDSGQFEIVVVDGGSKMELLANLPRIYRGTHLKHPSVTTMKGHHVRAFSPEKVLLDIDGEQPGCLDAEITILPASLHLIC